jgi:hypothetical protein
MTRSKLHRQQVVAASLAVVMSAAVSSGVHAVAPSGIAGWVGAFMSALLLVGFYAALILIFRHPRSHR